MFCFYNNLGRTNWKFFKPNEPEECERALFSTFLLVTSVPLLSKELYLQTKLWHNENQSSWGWVNGCDLWLDIPLWKFRVPVHGHNPSAGRDWSGWKVEFLGLVGQLVMVSSKLCVSKKSYLKNNWRARELAQQLRTHACLSQDSGAVLSTLMQAHNHSELQMQDIWCHLLASWGRGMHKEHTHMPRKHSNTIYKINIKIWQYLEILLRRYSTMTSGLHKHRHTVTGICPYTILTQLKIKRVQNWWDSSVDKALISAWELEFSSL